MPANNCKLPVPKTCCSLWCMWSKVMFPTIEISSIIISFSSENDSLNWVFFWSDIAGRLSLVCWGIARAVFIVVPLILIADTPVGAIKSSIGSSGFLQACRKVLAAVWYIVFIKWLFPAPAPPVIKRYIGLTSSGFRLFIFLILLLHQDRTVSYA